LIYATDERLDWEVLPTTVEAGLECLLGGLEACYGGPALVGRVLGLLTLTQLGLTDAELLDVLSLDDVVFDELPSAARPPFR